MQDDVKKQVDDSAFDGKSVIIQTQNSYELRGRMAILCAVFDFK